MNINFGLLPGLEVKIKKRKFSKKENRQIIAERALKTLQQFIENLDCSLALKN